MHSLSTEFRRLRSFAPPGRRGVCPHVVFAEVEGCRCSLIQLILESAILSISALKGEVLSRASFDFWFFSSIDAGYTADDSAHREFATLVREENVADACATVEPAFEDREVLHCFERRMGFKGRNRVERMLDAGFHRLRFGVLGRLDRENRRPGETARADAEKGHAVFCGTRLNEDAVQVVEAVNDLGQLSEHRPELFDARMQC